MDSQPGVAEPRLGGTGRPKHGRATFAISLQYLMVCGVVPWIMIDLAVFIKSSKYNVFVSFFSF